jgi:hypothetical protein
MGVQIPAGFAQASFGGYIAGDTEEAIWTIGFSVDGGVDPSIALAMYGNWLTNFQSLSSTDWTFASCRVKYGPTSTGPTVESVGATATGSVSEITIPINTALLVRKITGTGGRRGRGRAYLVGQLMNGMLGGAGVIDSTPLSALQSACDDFYDDCLATAGVSQLVLLHSDAGVPSTIVGLQAQQKVATQRRRLRP